MPEPEVRAEGDIIVQVRGEQCLRLRSAPDQRIPARPDGVPDDAVVFASDAMPIGWMAADFCDLTGGEVVAVWGAGGVGQMAARAAQLLGAERVIVVDRLPERLATAADRLGVETINYAETDVLEALRETTAGRGPDACIDAVGMESHDVGPVYAYDRAKQSARLQTDRPIPVRQAITAARKGGRVCRRDRPWLPGHSSHVAGAGRAGVRDLREEAGRLPAYGAASGLTGGTFAGWPLPAADEPG